MRIVHKTKKSLASDSNLSFSLWLIVLSKYVCKLTVFGEGLQIKRNAKHCSFLIASVMWISLAQMERRSKQGRPDESIFWHSYEMCQRKTNKGSCYNCTECDSVSGGAGLHIGPETAAGIGILPDTTPHEYTPIALALTGRKQCVLYSSLDAACSFF